MKSLHISRCEKISPRGVEVLEQLKNLQILAVSHRQMDDAVIVKLPQSLKVLYCHNAPQPFLETLRKSLLTTKVY